MISERAKGGKVRPLACMGVALFQSILHRTLAFLLHLYCFLNAISWPYAMLKIASNAALLPY
jgi:hypothetical protein